VAVAVGATASPGIREHAARIREVEERKFDSLAIFRTLRVATPAGRPDVFEGDLHVSHSNTGAIRAGGDWGMYPMAAEFGKRTCYAFIDWCNGDTQP